MSSVTSDYSHASALSKEIMDNVSRKSETKLFKKEANVDETTISKAWNAFGLYLARNLRAGRAVNVLHLGVFSFGAPEIKLTGVTNPEDRDLRYRTPVFLVSKEFIKGMNIQTGIISSGIIRPFSMVGVISGIPEVKINHADIAYTAQLSKDLTKISIDRVIRELADKAKTKSHCELDIPHVGKILIRNHIAAVEFHDSLTIECLDSTNKTIQALKQKREKSMLTAQNLKDFLSNQGFVQAKDQPTIQVDMDAQSWLRNNLNIDIEALKNITRPQTAASAVSSLKSTNSIPWSRKSYSRNSSVRSRPNSERNSMRSFNSSTSRFTYLGEDNNDKDLPLRNLKKRLRHWIKKTGTSPEDAFTGIVRKVYGPKATITSKITVSEFRKGIESIEDLNLNVPEMELLCKILKQDGQTLVSFEKWAKLFMDEKVYSNYIKEIAVKYNMSIEDILRRMNINDKSSAQDLTTLKSNIKLLDPSIDDEKALRISKELIQDKQRIEANQLIDSISDLLKQSAVNNSAYTNQLIHIKKSVKDLNGLRRHFEKYDEKNQGLIDSLAFREALLKLNIGFTPDSAKQFIKNVDRDSDMNVDYIKFIDTIDKIRTEDYLQTFTKSSSHIELENFNAINEKLKEYFTSNKLQPSELIKKISIAQDTQNDQDNTRVSVEQFTSFLKQLCHTLFINKQSFLSFAKKLDVDRDGFISETDIDTFLNRNNYIKDGYKETLKNSQTNESAKYNLFPVAPLSEEKVEVILRDIRHALNSKRISFYDFNKMIDINRTGFITINDFCRGIDKVIKLSQPIKDGFYAYIDRERVGLVTYEEFVKVLKRSMVDKPSEVTEDSFDWQTEIISLIRNYANDHNLTNEDTFRILDADFDGYINKNDLFRFVNEALNIPKEEITKTRIDRLFKLLDIHKRERIQLNDIKALLGGRDITNKGGETTSRFSEKPDFDWMSHAKQQIGLELSKKYKSLEDSFKIVAQDEKVMKYDKFRKWLEYSQVLTEFQMTERLIQKLYANIDPHKKGYLDETDWVNTFSGYNIVEQLLSEVQQVILSQNSNVESAFEFFLSHENQIHPQNREVTFEGFTRALQALLPKRLEFDQIKYIWSKMASSKNVLSIERFNKLFERKEFNGTSYVSHHKLPKKTTLARSLYQSLEPNRTAVYGENISKEEKQRKIFVKLKQILNASKISVKQFFQDADANNSGDLSNLEFINALKRLNLGLNLKELEDLIIYCDSNLDGQINFREFASKFTPQFVENRIFDRARIRIKAFKDNIYSYMLSPKDAFLNFNKTRTGKLTYDQFNTLVVQLSILAREETPSFHIIKDLFDFLDLRKDGVIDMTEWMQSFRIIENETSGAENNNQAIKKRPATVNVNTLNKLHFNKVNPNEKLDTSSSVSSWECSKEYEKILKIIGRNRKVLTSTFEELGLQGVLVDFNKIKEVIGKLLETEGIKPTNDQWFYLYKFAEKDGVIDYKFMLDIFKERLYLLSAHPKAAI